MVDFAKEFHSPFRNFKIALGDTVKNTMGVSTVGNLICKIQRIMGWMKDSKDYEFSVSAGRGVAELLVDPIFQGGTTVWNV